MLRITLATLLPAVLLGQTCDRACLEGFVNQYVDALIAHNPKPLPVSRTLKNTENGVPLEVGDGFWRTATGKGAYRLLAADPQQGQVAFLGTMKEAATPVAVAIRLKVVQQQIAEIETLVARTGFNNTRAGELLEKLGQPHAMFSEQIPESERMTRAELEQVAQMYFSGFEKNDGRGIYPFTDDCEWFENGIRTTNNAEFHASARYGPPRPEEPVNPSARSCRTGMSMGYFHFVTRVRDRRFVALDPERGLVFSFVYFDHAAGTERTFKLKDGTDIAAGPQRPWTWESAQVLRIEKGRIRRVEALLEQVPYGMLSGWSAGEDRR